VLQWSRFVALDDIRKKGNGVSGAFTVFRSTFFFHRMPVQSGLKFEKIFQTALIGG
jgi:hypothetical protein